MPVPARWLGLAAAIPVVALGSSCTGDGSEPHPPTSTTVAPCDELRSDSGPVVIRQQEDRASRRSDLVRRSSLPAVMTASAITAEATPLLQDPPGRVRMIAFWGEPGAHEPGLDTPVTFLGVDGRWRSLTRRDLGDRVGYLSSGYHDLAPDGSRWVVASRGWTSLLDFGTGELVHLVRDRHGALSASWSPDSRAVALSRIDRAGVEVFDRSGRRIGGVPVDAGKRQVLMPNAGAVTVFDQVAGQEEPHLRFTTYDLTGERVATTSCALPSGYPGRATAVAQYDGEELSIQALVDTDRYVYRHSTIDLSSGAVTEDFERAGAVPYLQQVVQPGVSVAGILGAPDGIYAVDPGIDELVRLGRLEMYEDQEGYENHANSQFAADLVLDGD